MKRPRSTACYLDSDRNGIRVEVCLEKRDVIATAYAGDAIVGQAVLEAGTRGKGEIQGRVKVGEIEVAEGVRRAGIGTRLYEAAVRVGCKAGLPLESDSMRSHYAEAFWRKQQIKGRAVCEPGHGEVYVGPTRGKERAGLPVPSENPRSGDPEWPCRKWIVREPCTTESLAGMRARKSARTPSRTRARAGARR